MNKMLAMYVCMYACMYVSIYVSMYLWDIEQNPMKLFGTTTLAFSHFSHPLRQTW